MKNIDIQLPPDVSNTAKLDEALDKCIDAIKSFSLAVKEANDRAKFVFGTIDGNPFTFSVRPIKFTSRNNDNNTNDSNTCDK